MLLANAPCGENEEDEWEESAKDNPKNFVSLLDETPPAAATSVAKAVHL